MTEQWFYDIPWLGEPPAGDWRPGPLRVGIGDAVEFRAPRRTIRAPRPPYNWAEGSRAIEARRGAAKMRQSRWAAQEYHRMMMMLNLRLIAPSVFMEAAGIENPEVTQPVVMLPHPPEPPTRWQRIKQAIGDSLAPRDHA